MLHNQARFAVVSCVNLFWVFGAEKNWWSKTRLCISCVYHVFLLKPIRAYWSKRWVVNHRFVSEPTLLKKRFTLQISPDKYSHHPLAKFQVLHNYCNIFKSLDELINIILNRQQDLSSLKGTAKIMKDVLRALNLPWKKCILNAFYFLVAPTPYCINSELCA